MNPMLFHIRPTNVPSLCAPATPWLGSLRVAAVILLMAEGFLHAQNVAVMGATELTGGSASLRAYLDNPNNVSLLGCGVVFSPTSVNPNPMIGGTGITQITRDYLAVGPFQLEATGLARNTKYSFKAYVTHASATNYSTAATFTTLANHVPALTVNGAGNTPAFLNTGSLGVARSYHAAVLLADGKVLVAGGSTRTTFSPTAELYNPETAGWTTTGSLAVARDSPKATLLPNGHVLLTGGLGPANAAARAEIYDPATGIWTETARMLSPRYGQTSTLLGDNTVLLVGGSNGGGSIMLNSAELFSPATGSWTSTGSLATARYHHTATLLPNGKVLVAGGGTALGPVLKSAELYDPTTGVWTSTGDFAMARRYHTATLLIDGRVLIAGGQGQGVGNGVLTSVELYDPATGTWTPTGNLAASRSNHTATLLANGKIVVAGGRDFNFSALASAELYDPATGLWTPAASPGTARTAHTATRLANGRILLAGGESRPGTDPLGTTVLYDSADAAVIGGEGSLSERTGTFSHGDGNSSVTLSTSFGTITRENATGLWSWMATNDDGPLTRTVSILATDFRGATKSLAFTLGVTNTPPGIGITAPTTGTAGQSTSFVFTASDVSSADQNAGFEWIINYGDGSPIIKLPSGTASPLTTQHSYLKGGFYNASATAQDKDGGLSAATRVSFTISGTTAWQAWRQFNFPGGDGEELLDPDGDGVVNLIEFAFGLDPKSGASAPLPTTLKIGNQLVMSFDEAPGVRGSVVYGAEWSPDLLPESWTSVPDSGAENTHTFRVPIMDRRQIFMRLKVSKL